MLNTNTHTIYIRNIDISYPSSTPILQNCTATIPSGSVTYILGASGSGKSSLLQALIGLLPPSKGTLSIEKYNIYELNPIDLYSFIGVVFQHGALLEDRTIRENYQLILEQNTHYSSYDIEQRIYHVLQSVSLDPSIQKKYPAELSGGMNKKAALARALLLEKRILFCDEPTSGLDPLATKEINSLLHTLHTNNPHMTLCIISHDIQSALTYASHILFIQEKTLLSFSTTSELLSSEDPYILQFLKD